MFTFFFQSRFIQKVCFSLETVEFSSFFLPVEGHQGWTHNFIPYLRRHRDFDKYIGEFDLVDKKCVLKGSGTMVYSNGDVYEGDWKDNQRDGYGSVMTGDKLILATFEKDMAKSGVVYYLNGGYRYEGGLNETLQKHGAGELLSVEMRDVDARVRDALCVGEWQNDKRTAANVIKMFEFIWSEPAGSNLVHEPWFKSYMTRVTCVVNCRDLVSSRDWQESRKKLPGTESNCHPGFELANVKADQNWMQLVTVGKFHVSQPLPIPPPDKNYEAKSIYDLLRQALSTSVSDDDIKAAIDETVNVLKKQHAVSFVEGADLSPGEAQCLTIYTTNFLYEQLGKAMLSLDTEQIRPWSPYLHMVQSALDKLHSPAPTHSSPLNPDASPKLFTVV